MKINKSQLRKIILESLLVEAISVAQAEAKLKKEKIKIWKSMIFVMKRDGVDTLRAAANKYGYSPSPQKDRWKDPEAVDFAEKNYNGETASELFANIDSFVPIDVNDADRSNAILWLIKQFKSDLGLFFALTEEEVLIDANGGNQAEANLTNKIRNNLEKFSQFKHLINPPEKRDLFRIANTRELFSIVEAHDAVIDAENERLSARIDTQNVLNGFKSLTGKINATKENNTLILVKNPQTGFYTIPDENGFVIGEIHSKPASVKLGSGTDWCTAAPGLDYFNHYYQPNDPLYYIEDNGKRYQFSYGEEQFMDVNDTPVKYKLFQKYTDILKNLLIRRDGSVQNKKIENAGLVLKASDSDTTPEELDKLADHENRTVRQDVATNPSASDETLLKLASDKHWFVRETLAMTSRSKKSAEVFLKLSEDKDSRVRAAAARNRRIPVDFLLKLSEDEDYQVRAAVAGNITTPTDVLLKLANEANTTVQIALAGNQNTPMEVLEKLSSSENSYIRMTAAATAARVSSAAGNRLQERWMKIAGLLN